MSRVISAIGEKLHLLSGMAVLAMTLLMSLDVIVRYALKTSLLDTIEISSMLMGAVISLALASVTDKEEHIQFTLLTDWLSRRASRLTKAVTLIISATLFSILTWQATIRAFSSVRSGKFVGSLQIPVWPSRCLFALGCLLTALVLLSQLIVLFRHPPTNSNQGGLVNIEGEE